ncbi:MAG: leucine-rich repeat domain-containing protein [Anaerolineaceae bacterium]|nr:leucine-rich repeat domain-containing protein [Anaerolineaceae bacterium]
MKRYLILFLSLFFLFSVRIGAAQSDEPVRASYGEWDVLSNATGWTITAYRGTETNVVIPIQFDNIYVTQLAAELFMNDIFLERVVIPGDVSVIGRNIFNGCISLKEVYLPYKITSIPEGAFKGCSSLTSIALNATLTSIGKQAFADCTSLKEIHLPARISTLNESAFENCTSLNRVTVQRRLATLGANVFKGTAWLEKQTDEFVILGRGLLVKYNGTDRDVTIPFGVVAIANAFEDNTTIESVFVPETVRRIMQNAFKGAINLSSINMPPWLTTIGASAFEDCGKITSFEFPITLTSIGTRAFENCSSLTELVIPDRVKTLPARLAENCSSLLDIRIPELVTRIDKNSFIGLPNAQIHIFPGSEAENILKDYKIPYSYIQYRNENYIYTKDLKSVQIVRYIGNEAVVTIPEMIDDLPVTGIKTAAFQNNHDVRAVFLPSTLENIGDWAFSYMDELLYIGIPDGFRRVGDYAFFGSPKLTSLRLPKRVVSVGDHLFSENSSLIICAAEDTKVYRYMLDEGFMVYTENFCEPDDSINYFQNTGDDSVCSCDNCENSESEILVQIPDGLKSVTSALLSNAGTNIVLSIPSSVESIDPEILEERTVTIISDVNTAAEDFAIEHGLKFLVRVNLWTEN